MRGALHPDLFQGRSVLVFGGTGGIGRAVAERFGQLGAHVTAAGLPAKEPWPDHGDRTDDAAGEVAGEVGRVVELDLTRIGEVEALIEAQERLDVLVNCAGMIRRGQEYRPEVFAQVIEVNLTGTMRACVAAHPLLAASGGSIVNVASMLSYFGGPMVPAYSASKGGVVQLTKALAVHFAPDGIRVNAVAPGWIRTDLTAELQEDPQAERRILDRTPMGRWGEPGDLTEVVGFLASPGAGFITGAVVPADGGYLAA